MFAVGRFLLWHRCIRSAATALSFAIGAAALGACNLTGIWDDRRQDVIDKVRAVDLLPANAQPTGGTVAGAPRSPRDGLSKARGRRALADAQSQPTPSSGEGFELNFENTPVTTVAKVILGDILGVGYTIDPRVQGTVSLASGRPVPKSEMLYVLETALRISNVALIRDPVGYRLVPAAEAVGSGNLDRSAPGRAPEPGYGISVVPLQYVSAQTLIKLLDSFATKPNSVRADVGRNIIIIQGSSVERRAEMDTVLSFDTDWMRGQSVGDLSGAQQHARTAHRGDREDHGYRRGRPQPEHGQVASRQPAQRHSGRHAQAGAAANRLDLDLAARRGRQHGDRRQSLPRSLW